MVLGIAVIVAWSAPAKVTPRPLRDNPYRNVGGSCVFDRAGKLVHAPKGSNCGSASPAPAAPKRPAASETPSSSHDSSGTRGVPRLLADHQHIAEEIGLLRVSIARQDRAASLEAVDRVLDELVAHLEHEEKLFKQLSGRSAGP